MARTATERWGLVAAVEAEAMMERLRHQMVETVAEISIRAVLVLAAAELAVSGLAARAEELLVRLGRLGAGSDAELRAVEAAVAALEARVQEEQELLRVLVVAVEELRLDSQRNPETAEPEETATA